MSVLRVFDVCRNRALVSSASPEAQALGDVPSGHAVWAVQRRGLGQARGRGAVACVAGAGALGRRKC